MRDQQNSHRVQRVSKGRFHDVDEVRAWAMAREQRAAFFKARVLRKLWLQQQKSRGSAGMPNLTGAQAYTAI